MNRDYQLALLAAAVTALPGVICVWLGLSTSIAVIATVGAAVAAILVLSRRWYRQIIARINAQTAHLRSVIGITSTVGDVPIFWSEHAIPPETLASVQNLIVTLKARRILELGSGLSTLVIASSLRRAGAGHVLSLDHDSRWAALTHETLRREGLGDYAEVRVAPLVGTEAGGRRAPWYDLSGLDAAAQFDLVIVDGPPAWQGDRLARLPALYKLARCLSLSGVLVLDDAARDGEREVTRQWRRDFLDFHFKAVDVGRGLFIASRNRANLDLLPIDGGASS